MAKNTENNSTINAQGTFIPIVLYIMGRKGFDTLKAIVKKHVGVVGTVVSARDPSIQNDYFNEIHAFCIKHKIPFLIREQSSDIEFEYAFAISWRWLIDVAQGQLIIFHDSLLPRHRGFNPLVTCLVNGETEIGVTALFATSEYDKGDIIAQESIKIKYPITIHRAIESITPCYINLSLDIIDKISSDKPLKGTRQDESLASISLWRDEDDYRIDWSMSACYIKRFIDAVGYPYRGAFTKVDKHPARVLEADIFPDFRIENRTPGKVIFLKEGFPVVVCGENLLLINKLVSDISGESMLPLKKFRTRFT